MRSATAPGRNAQTLQGFFDELTEEQKMSITAVSIDMSAGYENAIRSPDGLPNAEVCCDPFHVCQLGGRAAAQVRRDEYNRHGRSGTGEGRWIKGTQLAQIHPRHRVQHEPREVPVRQPIPHIRRQQKRLITVTPDEVLSHPRMVLNPPDDTVITRHPLALAIVRCRAQCEIKAVVHSRERGRSLLGDTGSDGDGAYRLLGSLTTASQQMSETLADTLPTSKRRAEHVIAVRQADARATGSVSTDRS